ncbi:MAG: adenylate/guanylate cyclase domain-containing protein [Austwickia sp.]|nr:MAG: adenylate/guanylate cyclase domain-containing protein [Austwickia sp.]
MSGEQEREPGPERPGSRSSMADDPHPALLGHPHEYMRREVSEAVGVSLLSARRFWHALGFPRVGDDDVVFTEADVQALDRVVSLVRAGVLDDDSAMSLTRAMARSADRLAAWQTQLVWELVQERRQRAADAGEAPDGVALETAAAELTIQLADEIEPLLVYAWRRHLAAAVARLASQAEPLGAEHNAVVGFADMVGFTQTVRHMSERQLGRMVQRFEAIAADTVAAYGGRLVKTLGDEVLFSCRSPVDAAGISLTMVEGVHAVGDMPPLRVGLAHGPVLSRLGDLFGTTVNRAARLTSLAHPDTVLVDAAIGRLLHDRADVRLSPMRPRDLRGLGPTRAHVLRPGPDGPPVPAPLRR